MNDFKKANSPFVSANELNTRCVAFARGKRHALMKKARRVARRKLKNDLCKMTIDNAY